MVKRGRVIAVLGVLIIGTVGSIAVVKGKPAWERHQVISALDEVPGVRSADLSSPSASPAVVLDDDLEQAKVEETVTAVYQAAEAQDLDSSWVYTTYRGVEIALDSDADTRWIEAAAVLARQPGVSSGEATPYKVEAKIDGSVIPALTGFFDWVKEREELDPKMLIAMRSESAFSVETSVGSASADLAALAKIPGPESQFPPQKVSLWGDDAPFVDVYAQDMPEAYAAMTTYAALAPEVATTIEVGDKSTLRVRHPDTSRMRAFIDDMTRIDATVVDVGTSMDDATVGLPVPELGSDASEDELSAADRAILDSLTTVSDRINRKWPGIARVTIAMGEYELIKALPGAVAADFAPVVDDLWTTSGSRANVDGHWGKKEPYELLIAIGPSSSIDSIARTIREAGFPGRIKISLWDRRDGGNGTYFGSFETTATSRASKFDPGISDDSRELLTAWNATAP